MERVPSFETQPVHADLIHLSMSDQPCPEKKSLTELLNQARIQYALATSQLETMYAQDFKAALRKAQEAKAAYQSARAALEDHVKEHCC